MARSFNGSSQYFELAVTGGIGISLTAVTVAIRLATSNSGTTRLCAYNETDVAAGTQDFFIAMNDGTAGQVRVFRRDQSTNTVSMTNGTTWNDGAFHSVVYRASALNSHELLIDGVSRATSTTNLSGTLTDADYAIVGMRRIPASNTAYFDGRIAEIAIWNVSLSDAEVEALTTHSALSINRTGLLRYWPLFGRGGASSNEEDWAGGAALPHVNSPTVSDHPRIIYPGRRSIWLPTTGGSTQDLTPSLFTNTQTFHAATVTPGAVTLTPALFTNTNTLYAPTVAGGTVTLQPSLFTNSQTFYAPTVTSTYALTPAKVTNTQTFYGPTITQGAAQIYPALFTNTQIFYGPTVTGGIPVVTTREQPAGRPSKSKAPSKRKRKPVVVSIDGEDFVVSSEAEAAQLLDAARDVAEQKAKEEAAEVLRKRRFKAARGSRLNTSPVTLDVPEVTVRSADDVRADPKWMRDLIEQFTSAISTEYEAAARDAEIAVNMDRRRLEDDEDEAIIHLLFTI